MSRANNDVEAAAWICQGINFTRAFFTETGGSIDTKARQFRIFLYNSWTKRNFWMCPTQKWRQNFHLSDSESPIFFDKKSRHGKLSKKKLHCFEMSQTRQGQLDTLKNNRLLTLKATHALIFYRKNSGFHYLKDKNFAFVSALSSFKNSSSFRSYREKSEIAVLWYLCYHLFQ